MIRRLGVGILLKLQVIVFEDENTRFILVATAIIGSREDCDDVWEAILGTPAMHLEALLLDLMATEDTQESIFAKQLLNWLLTEIV